MLKVIGQEYSRYIRRVLKLAVVLFLFFPGKGLASTTELEQESTIKCQVYWNTVIVNKDVAVRSVDLLSPGQIRWVMTQFLETERQFSSYYNKNCPTLPRVEVRIIYSEQLNSPNCFPTRDYKNIFFGEFNRKSNIIYLTPGIFRKDETLIHEYLHFLYDECGFWFDSDEKEHQAIKVFFNSIGKDYE